MGVSIPAIGEAFHTIGEDSDKVENSACGEAAVELRRLVEGGKLVLVGVGGSNEVYSISRRLAKADRDLDPVDALILSVACLCKCPLLYTTDGVLLEHIKIANIAKEYGVRIREPPSFERRCKL